ncbi:unnamed protein product [Lampetra fluviatilis]
MLVQRLHTRAIVGPSLSVFNWEVWPNRYATTWHFRRTDDKTRFPAAKTLFVCDAVRRVEARRVVTPRRAAVRKRPRQEWLLEVRRWRLRATVSELNATRLHGRRPNAAASRDSVRKRSGQGGRTLATSRSATSVKRSSASEMSRCRGPSTTFRVASQASVT